ncbi:hypothetical protein SAMN05445850_4107 [Paraburkholderia tuberum]|uniref:Uncharacterized protein n=1 Tax=Paraburkholderia tuberum TaxID=157910 RepID=A0A1H1J3Y3_9BURK|nr:hypothetical protein SAMN05445850_4107 [Paraburkholderia tuberum]
MRVPLVYDEESKLVDLNTDELLEALSAIARLKKHFRVMDPSAALAEVARFVRGEQQLVPCIGGSKYFYIDWNLDVWRCEAWPEPMGSVFDLDRLPDQRQPCNDCMMGCYRHASILMHGAVAVTDSVYALGKGQLRAAVGLLFQRSVAYSVWALSVEELPRAALISFARRTGQRRSTPQAE